MGGADKVHYGQNKKLRLYGEISRLRGFYNGSAFHSGIIAAVSINDIINYDGDWLIIKGIKYDETDGITLTGNDLNGVLSQRIAPPDQISGTSTAGCISHYLCGRYCRQ